MNKEAIKKQIIEILQTVLGISKNSPLVRNTLVEWDSVKHIEIIMALEEEFNITFNFNEIPSIASDDDLLNLILEKLHAANL